MSLARLVVFASGTGSNFQAIIQASQAGELEAQVVGLVCDVPSAPVIGLAAMHHVPVLSVSPNLFANRDEYERAILRFLEVQRTDWVALAGYMRIVGPVLLEPYVGRILNLHPALLPEFPGREAIRAAHQAGVETTGVTVHLIDSGVDTGPIVAQQELPVDSGWSLADLEERIHRIEHELYPRVLQDLVSGKRYERTT